MYLDLSLSCRWQFSIRLYPSAYRDAYQCKFLMAQSSVYLGICVYMVCLKYSWNKTPKGQSRFLNEHSKWLCPFTLIKGRNIVYSNDRFSKIWYDMYVLILVNIFDGLKLLCVLSYIVIIEQEMQVQYAADWMAHELFHADIKPMVLVLRGRTSINHSWCLHFGNG